ncbi:alpha-ketoglutarate-dependent dioxygenase AlkB [Aeromicrobium sp. PE09-221]|uniref:alpha-ketoglutarate-dependent dioxygenase AlkB n=1 Tax=Aeromicrobium sp. PE09-221 TaxID=1898043 RepID=UPI000B3ED1C3|nr:alpha-ketoglutarate-dependent dioxygenase AlkB [Aeromicrobium sp. PE09-221]OUZ09403.1 alpha-ketoglutarate-dependent dioxygenase AlkB [Aeromicrobium sp. PE09-221]
MWFQGSLLDGAPEVSVGELGSSVERVELDRGAWVDLRYGWLSGADQLFATLQQAVPWRAERREMYERVVDVPRLLCHYRENDELPDPVLVECREMLSAHYADELGETFATAGLCYYRDGRDSVAWHGDRIGRGAHEDTMVAILSLGEHRRLSLRPRGGGPQLGYTVGHGDLLVMGGSCQRTWEHAVLKTARAGPRISVQFRPRGVL